MEESMGMGDEIMNEVLCEGITMIHQSKKKKHRLHLSYPTVSSSIETSIAQEELTDSNIEQRDAGKNKDLRIRRSTRKRKPPTRFGEGNGFPQHQQLTDYR
jgi:hypothetical protein